MSILIDGATYRFENRADGNRSLNVYGTSPAILSNVCLWGSDDDDICQQWVYEESATEDRGYLRCKGASNLYLDVYTGSGASTVVGYNAHVYTKSSTAFLEIEEISGGYIRIKSMYNDRYLTANQNSGGTSSGTDVNAAGNVYFYGGGLTDLSQDWLPVRLDGGTDPDPGDDALTSDVIVSKPNNTYLSQRADTTWAGFDSSYPVGNFKSSGCSAVAATMMARIMENKATITTKNLYDWGVWSVRDNFPWANWTQNKNSQLHFTYEDPATKGWSTAKGLIFDEIVNDRPVIIYLKNDTLGTSHFVVGYGLKRGASRDNLQYDQVMVYNPDPQGAVEDGTLADMMKLNIWKDFGSIRRAFTD